MQIKTGDKTGVEIEEYQGRYALASLYIGTDGKMYKEWAYRQYGKDKVADKATPIKVSLGDKQQAIDVCREMLKYFGHTFAADQLPVDSGDDVPF